MTKMLFCVYPSQIQFFHFPATATTTTTTEIIFHREMFYFLNTYMYTPRRVLYNVWCGENPNKTQHVIGSAGVDFSRTRLSRRKSRKTEKVGLFAHENDNISIYFSVGGGYLPGEKSPEKMYIQCPSLHFINYFYGIPL